MSDSAHAVAPLTPEITEDLRSWRRHMHAHPELGFEEHETAAFIRAHLQEWGLPFNKVLDTGTVAYVRGEIPGPTLVLRADIDALAVQDEKDVDYASTVPGVMHACGHDGHTAIMLGLAKILAHRKYELRGEIRLLFQPAEEVVGGGAPGVIDAGALDGARAVVGLHLDAPTPIGTIGIADGTVMACDDRFEVTIHGAGGHVALPHESTDALMVAAGLVSELPTIIGKRVNPLEAAVVGVGSFHSGDAYNAIPGVARLTGSVRALSAPTRDLLEREVTRLAKGYAAAHNATAEVVYHRGAPPLINDSLALEFVRPAAEAAVGVDQVKPTPPDMGGEDFAFYGELLPTAYVYIGAGGSENVPHHHPKFDIDEDSLAIGLRFFQYVVNRWSNPALPVPDLSKRS